MLMSKLNHPNLVKLNGILLTPLSLVMEFCDQGSLYEFILKNELTWKQRFKFLLDVARGVQHLHSFKPPVVHRGSFIAPPPSPPSFFS